jgi:hypothetical protein
VSQHESTEQSDSPTIRERDAAWGADTELERAEQSDIAQARRLAREVVSRDDCRLIEALLADAIGHLADEVERTRNRLDALEEGSRS